MVSDHIRTPWSRPKDYLTDPKIPYAPADMFQSDPLVYLTYHVTAAGYGALTPIGCSVGALLYGGGFRPYPTMLASMGTAGLVAGVGGIALGYYKMNAIQAQGETRQHPRPWNEEGHKQRLEYLSHNFKARLLDVASASGMALATGAMLVKGGPSKLGFSPGTMGVLQSLSVGSAAGGVGALILLYSLSHKDQEED